MATASFLPALALVIAGPCSFGEDRTLPVPAASTACVAAPGTLRACPGSGPVGTRIVVAGNACHDVGQTTVFLAFQRLATSPPGAAEITRDAPVAADGTFAVEWVVPAEIGELMDSGGGPTTPGKYELLTKPPRCHGTFTVT